MFLIIKGLAAASLLSAAQHRAPGTTVFYVLC